MAISLSSISKFFTGESSSIYRTKNALRSNRLISFVYDGTIGVIKATVQPSMKKRAYHVAVNCFAELLPMPTVS
jgi:hypothetical protein